MFSRKVYLIIFFPCCLLLACHNDRREQDLVAREQQLLKKEQEFAQKEADYNALLRMRDSLNTKHDTIIVQQWPETLASTWAGKTVCRESNCNEYQIGDQRNNSWEFVGDSTGIFSRVLDGNNKLVRVYNARYDSTNIHLYFLSDSSTTKKMEINIDLVQANADLLKGTQTVRIDQTCTAKFSVELSRKTKP